MAPRATRKDGGGGGGTAAGPVAQVTPKEARAIHEKIRNLNYLSLGLGVVGLALKAYGYRKNQADWLPEREGADTFFTVGAIIFIIALGVYAKMKGRNILFGLLGILSIIGLLGLLFQKGRCHFCGRMNPWNTKECPDCAAPTALGWKPAPSEE